MLRRVPLALIAVTAAALVLRLVGIGHQLPYHVEPDLYTPLLAQRMALEAGVESPGWLPPRLRAESGPGAVWVGYYPPLLARVVLTADPDPFERPPAEPARLEEHLRAASAPLVRARLVLALIAALLVPGTYVLARRFLPRPPALLAAALVATSALHIWFGAQARPHAASASLVLLGVLAALRLRRAPTLASYALAGLAGGLGAVSLQTGVLMLPSLFIAHLARERGARASRLGPLVALLLLAVAGLLGYPQLARKLAGADAPGHGAVHVESRELHLIGQPLPLDQLFDPDPARVLRPLWSYDPGLLALAALGLAAGLALLARRRRGAMSAAHARDLAVVAAHALPLALVLTVYGRTNDRYLIPLLPYLALLAAAGWWWLVGRRATQGTSAARRAALVASGLAVLALPTAVASKLALLRARPDSFELAARWLLAEIDLAQDPPLLAPGLLLPMPWDGADVVRSLPARWIESERWTAYLARGASFPPEERVAPCRTLSGELRRETMAERGWRRELPGALVVRELSQRTLAWPPTLALDAQLRRLRAETLARFGPVDAPDAPLEELARSAQVGYQNQDDFARRVLAAERLGPVLELLRVPGAPD